MGLDLMPDTKIDEALADAGICYFDIVKGGVRIDFTDGDTDLITGVSLRHYLRLRNQLQQYRGQPVFLRVGERFAVNNSDIRDIGFTQSDDGAVALFEAIRSGRAGPEDLRAFALQRAGAA